MSTKPFLDLLDDVLPELAADPSNPVTEAAIRRASIDFCAGSRIWQVRTDPMTVFAGEGVVDIDVPNGADVAEVLDAALHGAPLDKKTVAWLNATMPGWRTETAVPRFYTQMELDQVMLAPAPNARGLQALVLTVAFQPSASAEGLPAWIARQYHDALVDGTLARLMNMNAKPWTDKSEGMARRSSFETAMTAARLDGETAFGGAPIRNTSYH